MTEQEVYAKIVECRTLWGNRDVTVETMENIVEDMSVMLFSCPESVYWSVVATIEECEMRMRYLPSNKLFIRKQDEGGLFTTGWIHTEYGKHGCNRLRHMQKAQELLQQFYGLELSPLMAELKLHSFGWRRWESVGES